MDFDIITVDGKCFKGRIDKGHWFLEAVLPLPLKFRKVDDRGREIAVYGAGKINEVATAKCTGAVLGDCVIISRDAFEALNLDERRIE